MIFFRSSGIAHALRIVWITLHHLCLSASCLDSLLGRSGESRSLDSELLGQLSAAKNPVAITALRKNALLQQGVDRDDVTVQPDNDQTRGKIAKIGYLLQVTEVK